MSDGPTCGQGLAEHSALPLKLAEIVAALRECGVDMAQGFHIARPMPLSGRHRT